MHARTHLRAQRAARHRSTVTQSPRWHDDIRVHPSIPACVHAQSPAHCARTHALARRTTPHAHTCRAPRRVPRVLSTPYPQVKRVVGNERTSQSRQAVEQRKAAGRDEDGRDRPVTVTNSRGQKKTLGADWHTQAQAGRTSESVSPAPTSTRSTHTRTRTKSAARAGSPWLAV